MSWSIMWGRLECFGSGYQQEQKEGGAGGGGRLVEDWVEEGVKVKGKGEDRKEDE